MDLRNYPLDLQTCNIDIGSCESIATGVLRPVGLRLRMNNGDCESMGLSMGRGCPQEVFSGVPLPRIFFLIFV